MDIATVVGLILGFGLVIGSILIGGELTPFIDIPSLMITVGGSFAALLINFPLRNVMSVFAVIKKCFTVKLPSTAEQIEKFKHLAGVVRSQGMLALEGELPEMTDEFLVRGLEMVIGGASKESLEKSLETEVSYVAQRHAVGKKIVEAMAAAAPAFGMIGTLIGLVQMLRSLDDPSQIGGGMAVALLTTLYGAVISNMVCIPLAGKLEMRSNEEVMVRELTIAGLGALVEGESPRQVEERLLAFVSAASRPAGDQAEAA